MKEKYFTDGMDLTVNILNIPKNNSELTSIEQVFCPISNTCDAFKNNQCIYQQNKSRNYECVYPLKHINRGFTKKAKKYQSWIDENYKEELSRFEKIDDLYVIGNHIYNPFVCRDLHWIRISNIKNLEKLFRNNYDDKDYANRISHYVTRLKENYPILYDYANTDNHLDKYLITESVGRYAYLKTMNKDIEITYYNYLGKIDFTLRYDGVYTYHKQKVSIRYTDDLETLEIKSLVTDKSTVKITDESQVNENTRYCYPTIRYY